MASEISRRALLEGAGACAATLIGAPALAQEKIKVSLITTQGIAGLTLQDIAFSQGFISGFGLDAEALNVSDASKVIAGLIGRSSDICMWSGLGGVPAAIEKGAPLKIVGGSLLFPTHAIFTSRPNINRVSDLVGKTIGVGALGTQLHQVMLAILRKKGVDASTVTFRNVGSSTDVFRSIAAGTVDAGPSEVDVLDSQEKYKVHTLSDGDLWTEVPEFTFQAAYATDDAIAKKRPALVRALAAFCKTYRFISSPDSKDAWVKSYLKVSGKTDPKEAITQWDFIQKYKTYATDLVLGPDRIQFMQQLNVDLGVQTKVLPYEQVADMSLAQEALKLVG